MNRTSLLIVACVAACCVAGAVASCASRSDFDVLTQEEIKATETLDFDDSERGGEQPGTPRPGAPILHVKQPEGSTALKSPIDIEVSFEPQDDARIDPATLRVIYAKADFRKDLTDLMRLHGQVSETGFAVHGAALPHGRHQLIVEISDDEHRVGRTVIGIEIADTLSR